jgi:hypothetical protein
MDDLGKAYLFAIVFAVAYSLMSLFSQLISFSLLLVQVFVVGHFIGTDAKNRGKSKNHQLWAWLGIIGVLIYHLAFARTSQKTV